MLGPVVPADRLTVTLGVGASLFDGRFGLAARKPAELTTMPTFADDHLDPAAVPRRPQPADLRRQPGHGRRTPYATSPRPPRGAIAVRWRVDGFQSPPRPSGTPRNLLGFKDGTSNLDTTDAAVMDRLVWLGRHRTAVDAAAAIQVIRTIRMLVEFWDRIGITEQENLIGRRRDTGAPMDGDARDRQARLRRPTRSAPRRR